MFTRLLGGSQPAELLRRAAWLFVPLAVVATMLWAAMYAVLQHHDRAAANDPQLQIAEDAARRLDQGASPVSLAVGPEVDLRLSLAPHLSIYDASGKVLASSARLDGDTPVPPRGVLDSARNSGSDIVTWQPTAGVRVAAVVIPFDHGTVLAGRSLRLVEQRVDELGLMVLAGWVITLAMTALTALVAARFWPSRGDPPVPGEPTGR